MWKILIGAAAGYFAGKAASGKNSDTLRPLAKAALKTGMQVLEKGYEAASHLRETLEDAVAEARADMEARAAAAQQEQEQEHETADEPQTKARRQTKPRTPKPQQKGHHARTSHD